MSYDWQKTVVMSDAIKQLFKSNFLSDTQVLFEDGRVLHTHALILSLRSPKLYQNIVCNKSDTNKWIIYEKRSYEIFEQLLKYFYTDICDINEMNFIDLMEISKEYLIETLEQECNYFILNNFHPCRVLNLSIFKGWKYLTKISICNIAENYANSLNHPEFLKIDFET